MTSFPDIERGLIAEFLKNKQLLAVVAAPEGRFILPIPDLKDGKGPILSPNIKELEARIRGSTGHLQALELEAGPQRIPADGSNVLVINRVDEFVQLALKAKLDKIVQKSGLDRAAITEFMSYARGYDYNPEKQEITFTKSAGFHNDVYNIPLEEFTRRYVSFDNPKVSLEGTNVAAGHYVKKPLKSKAAFIKGRFSIRVRAVAGGTVQEFETGAMINIPDDPALPLSCIHPTDIDISYRKADGSPLSDASALPVFEAADILKYGEKALPRRNQS